MFINKSPMKKFTEQSWAKSRDAKIDGSTFSSDVQSFESELGKSRQLFEDFNLNIGRHLYKSDYISDGNMINLFCPLCLGFVHESQKFTMCFVQNARRYIVHDNCLLERPEFPMIVYSDQQDHMKLLSEPCLCATMAQEQKNTRIMKLNFRNYILEISFVHPITEKSFGSILRSVHLPEDDQVLSVSIGLGQDVDHGFQTNSLLLPCTDYVVRISISEVGQGEKEVLTKYVNFSKIQAQNAQHAALHYGEEDVQFSLNINSSENQKEQVLTKSNQKYRFQKILTSIVELEKIDIALPQKFNHEEGVSEYSMMGSASNLTLSYLDLDEKITESANQSDTQQSTHKNSRPKLDMAESVGSSTSFHSEEDSVPLSQQSLKSKRSPSEDASRVNLERLIKTKSLAKYLQNNTQSRSFQSFLSFAKEEELSLIVEHLKEDFSEIIRNEYGNYMIQKLYQVSNYQLRVQILLIIAPSLCSISKNKQGTHAIQSFIALMTEPQEFEIVLHNLREQFFDMCVDGNSTHLIQKVFQEFPLAMLTEFLYYVSQHLPSFACNKHGLCVVKAILKRLSGKYNGQFIWLSEYQNLYVQSIMQSLGTLMSDNFGNYCVQFIYDNLPQQMTEGLTQLILSNFSDYSSLKYGVNVVLKCITIYWTDREDEVLKYLKSSLSSSEIVQMYKNKDGNKILLEIMERYEKTELWEKINACLLKLEPSRFYHDRWNVCLGVRSGSVGTKFTSFSDALAKDKSNFKKKF